MTHDINGTLEKRGLLAIAKRAGWTPYTLKRDGNEWQGWQYPVFNMRGDAYDRQRWKNANGTGPRYFWPKGQPDKSKYYFLPGLLTAIQQDSGAVYIAAGEPDVLAYHAAGIENVFCWLSAEISVPDTLIEDLRHMGARSVVYAPDRDKAGMKAAAKVAQMLDEAEIPYHMAQLPGEMGSKNDINTLWIDCKFDKNTFFAGVWMNTVDPTDLALYRPTPSKNGSAPDIEAKVKQWYRQWTDDITAALGPAAMTSGTRSFWRCPVSGRHHSGDANPSFRISTDQKPDQPWPVCSCDIQNDPDPWGAVAASVGVDKWQDYKKAKAWSELGVRADEYGKLVMRPTADGEKPEVSVVKMPSVYKRIVKVFEGDEAPKSKPIMFPYETLHQFGGFCHWMWTGKMIGVGGISSGGKTLYLRILFTAMIAAGYDMIWWGKEFSPDEYGLQDLIRAGGMNFGMINQLLVIRALQHEHKISEMDAIKMSGLVMPGQATIQHSVDLLNKLSNQPGELFIIDDPNADVDSVMKTVKGWSEARRKEGREVGGLGWDYLQIANMPGKRDWTWGNRVADTIKTGCSPRNANLVAFISSQSRKSDAQKVRQDHKLLTVDAAQGLDESLFNLWITLTPGFLNGTKQPWAILSVEKNSMGALGKVAVEARWDRLLIMDQKADINVENYLSGGIKADE
jgi:hypothetical protein